MIGRLTGTVVERLDAGVVLDVQGVGYEVDVPVTALAELATGGGQNVVTLHTHLAVREDAQQLFGFLTRDDRDLFRALIRVNGVGPRLGLAILSSMNAAELAATVHGNDVKAMTAVSGVGKKTAERLILDLKDKLPESPGGVAQVARPAGGNLDDAELALIGLGYKPQEAALAVSRVPDASAPVESIIRQALKLLG